MKPQITVITLGVNDLEASLRFYLDGLGFPTEGIVGKEFAYGAVVHSVAARSASCVMASRKHQP